MAQPNQASKKDMAEFVKNFNKIMKTVDTNSKEEFKQSIANNSGKGFQGVANTINDMRNIKSKAIDIISGKTQVNPADQYNWGGESTNRGYVRGTAVDPMSPVTLNGGSNDPATREKHLEAIKNGTYVQNPADEYGYKERGDNVSLTAPSNSGRKYYKDLETNKIYDTETGEELFRSADGKVMSRKEIEDAAKQMGTSTQEIVNNPMKAFRKLMNGTDTPARDSSDEYVEYTYKPGDTFGQVILDLGINTDKGLWGSGGDVEYYTKQLREQGIPGMVPIGTTIRLKKRK